jgi:membrane protein
MAWVYLSWVIVLVGAVISYAIQNYYRFEYKSLKEDSSLKLKILLSLQLLTYLLKKLKDGLAKVPSQKIHEDLKIPYGILEDIAEMLERARIIFIHKEEGESIEQYQVARDPETLTIASVLNTLYNSGLNRTFGTTGYGLERLKQSLSNIQVLIEKSPDNLRLKDLC